MSFIINESDSGGGSEAARTPAPSARQRDFALVGRFLAGEEAAFTEIMQIHSPRIFAAAISVLRNPSDAEEVVQDTFVRAHRGLAKFRGESSVVTWLHHIAVNLARNRYWYFYRRHRHNARSLEALVVNDGETSFAGMIADAAPDPAREASHREFSASAGACSRRLTPSQQKILAMRNSLGLPYEQIAEELKINIGTVKSRIARARRTLKEMMAENYPENGRFREGCRLDWFGTHRNVGLLVASSK